MTIYQFLIPLHYVFNFEIKVYLINNNNNKIIFISDTNTIKKLVACGSNSVL